ncbi:MAG: threonine synthase [Candidatus Marinimicrobia bacterium]|nr:threonine synthase [Candidatus Neomarinimicrobiota bacterium]MCF7828371.1 threonine synthase [Candidatus Neomarinimicrobiota bacterium]MCF7881035.1 threonine synthase [Candidatus Neomarinimicrobiota bacterium]
MQLYSTENRHTAVSLRTAVLEGMPSDGGLYMPAAVPELSPDFFQQLGSLSFQDISYRIASEYFQDEIPDQALHSLVNDAVNFDAPVVHIHDNIHTLELFHGPTLAFKDFGARFMARVMSWFIRNEDTEVTILVATSGDTGSAVAHGFLGVPGIRVVILYPGGKVSKIQEQQFTTLGQNITALEIDGNFDDCQRLVKAAFVDPALNESLELTSANSINIARLIPQSFYYVHGYAQICEPGDQPVISVPSGNYGNLTAGLLAKRMGLPVHRFIAASNVNDVVPAYLDTGSFDPRASVETISNAMDVGNPSNFARMLDLYDHDPEKMRDDIVGMRFIDDETRQAIQGVYNSTGYLMDPHGAVGYLALKNYTESLRISSPAMFLETAHPAKFLETVEPLIEMDIPVPARLQEALEKEKKSIPLSASLDDLREFLMSDLN